MPYFTIPRGHRFHFKTGDGQAKSQQDKNKPTLVLLHHRAQDSTSLQPQLSCSKLTDKYNLIALDTHYHGLTKVLLEEPGVEGEPLMAKDLLSVLDALQIGRCHLFGANTDALNVIRMAIILKDSSASCLVPYLPQLISKPILASIMPCARTAFKEQLMDQIPSRQASAIQPNLFSTASSARGHLNTGWNIPTSSNPKHINKIFSLISLARL